MKSGNNEKTKKEHYIPQCYLKRWGNEKKQLYVYDIVAQKSWKSNIQDVACENKFYDINYSGLSNLAITLLREVGIDPEKDPQFIEHFFAKIIEDNYAECLTRLVDVDITPWYEKNCFFINEIDKIMFSFNLVFQSIRTKSFRKSIHNSSVCMEKLLKDLGCTEEVIKRHTTDLVGEKNIQGNMFFDINHICNLAAHYLRLTWILGRNKTKTPFYTSDNPIGTCPHVKDPFLPMNGIASTGVEVFFPLSPQHILLMYDGEYHRSIQAYDRRFYSIEEEELIERYNMLCVYNSSQYVIANTPVFDIVKKELRKDPHAFDTPKTVLHYGGKTYYSR